MASEPLSRVWVPHDKDVWTLATLEGHGDDVSTDKSDQVTVTMPSGDACTIPLKNTHMFDATHLMNLSDLCNMSNLHEAPLLDMLRRRSLADEIYTNTGSVLISINPYKLIEGMYDTPTKYYVPENNSDAIADLPPHVYKVANNAYMAIASNRGKNQSVVVSGESGAGKTEASKHVMNFLIAVNEADLTKDRKLKSKSPRKTTMETTAAGEHIKEVLLDSNVILECFGNSKTVRNDNSSRFGKYIRLQYTASKVLVSAYTETFLLEKSRLTNGTRGTPLDAGERNYHIMYGMFAGSDNTLKLSDLGLDGGINQFSILSSPSSDPFLPDDKENFNALCTSMRSLGVIDNELSEIWNLLSTILHLGNANVTSLDSLSSASDGSIPPAAILFPTSSLDNIAAALGVSGGGFSQALTIHLVQLGRRGSVTRKVLSVDEVGNNVNALMKWLYSGLFDWLVKKINFAHSGHATTSVATPVSSDKEAMLEPAVNFIGILDIFGFEILKTNSFEQLCINFTNERLQKQFNEHVFVHEQKEYEKEGLNWSTITFQDNQNVIDLICKKPSGLLNVLEEHGFLNRKPDDKALLTSYDQMHNSKHPCYQKPRFGNESFIIHHFAGDVTYSISGFLEKNNDTLQEDLLALLDTSTNEFISNVMGLHTTRGTKDSPPLGYIPPIPEHLIIKVDHDNATLEDEPGAAKVRPSSLRHSSSLASNSFGATSGNLGKKMASAVTVSYHFRHQLDELMLTLRATNPHYIKCIKPNTTKSPNSIMAAIVMEQLRYSGILEVVRIRRQGYPTRTPFKDFYEMFEILGTGRGRAKWNIPAARDCSVEEAKTASRLIASSVFAADPLFFQVGHNKIFLKNRGLDHMRLAVKNFYADRARIIQRKFKTRRQARWFQELRHCAMDIQKHVRRWRCYSQYSNILKAVKLIQWSVIGKRLRREFVIKCHMATLIRRRVRVFVIMRLFAVKKKIQLRAIIRIQRVHRGSVSRRKTKELRLSYTTAQVTICSIFRSYFQRKVYCYKISRVVLIQAIGRKLLARLAVKKRKTSCILLQSQARRFINRITFRNSLKRIVIIQSTARMAFAKNRLSDCRRKVVSIQRVVRMQIHFKRYRILRTVSVMIQSCVRGFLAAKQYKLDVHRIIFLQNFVRKMLAIQNFSKNRHAIILLQSFIRGRTCRKAFKASLRKYIHVQALIRMMVNRLRYVRIRDKVNLCQSMTRMMLQRSWFRRIRKSLILVQAVLRKFLCVKSFRRLIQQCVMIQKKTKGYIQCKKYSLMKSASKRMKACVRRFLRNLSLRKRIVELHRLCQSGDTEGVRNHLSTEYFTDLSVRNKWDTYNTCLQTACQFGQLAVIELLDPTPHEILQRDINGNSALHHAAMLPNIETVKALESRLVMVVTNAGITAAPVASSESQPSEAPTGGADSDDDDAAHELAHIGSLGDKIKEGYLKKVSKGRWGTRHQKRWVELHEEHILYFKNKGDKAPRGAVSIQGASVKRRPAASNKEGPSFEIFSDEISLKKKKDNASMLFVTDSEKELQEWLIPLKALVGLDSAFRTTSQVTYVNSGLRDAWLTETNNFGETPLHIASRFYNGACPFIRTQTVEKPISIGLPASNEGSEGLFTPKKQIKPKTLEPAPLSPFRPQVPLVRVLQLAMWLIEGGCGIDTKNLDGQTALHLAVQHRNSDLVGCLVHKGARTDIRDTNRSTPEYFANGSILDVLKRASLEYNFNNNFSGERSSVSFAPLLLRPVQISGYSYLSMHFMKHSISTHFSDSLNFSTSDYEFYLSLSVMNRVGELVEAKQDIRAPAIVRDSYVWWACTWNMQTPLENIEDKCSVRMDLCRINKASADCPPPAASLIPARRRSQIGMAAAADSVAGKGPNILSTSVFEIDFSSLDSGILNIPFTTQSDCGPVDHSFVQVDCMLLKRSKSIRLEKYRRQVYPSTPRIIWFDGTHTNYSTTSRDSSQSVTLHKSDTASLVLTDVDTMGLKELKNHLLSLGIPINTFLEVSDFRNALRSAITK